MIITEDQFIERFKPEENSDASIYRQRDWAKPEDWDAILAADRERRLWTQVDGDDGQWCVVSGFHRINRNYYIICAVPYLEGESFEISDPVSDEGQDLDDDIEVDLAQHTVQ